MSNTTKVVELPEDLQAFAEERVRAGEYANADEVMHEAFRLLRQRDERKQHVREDLANLFDQMETGTYLEPSDQEFETAVQLRAERLVHLARYLPPRS